MSANEQHGPAVIALASFIGEEVDEALGADLLLKLAEAQGSEGMLDDLYNSAVLFLMDEGYRMDEIDKIADEGSERVRALVADLLTKAAS